MPYGKEFFWEDDSGVVQISFRESWKQGPPITNGDVYCIISTICDFANLYLEAKVADMPQFSLLVTRNPSQFGAQTLGVKMRVASLVSQDNQTTVTEVTR